MIVFIFILALLCLWGFSIRRPGGEDYLSKRQGDAIKGIFILLVFLSHASFNITDAGYAYPSVADQLYLALRDRMGQLIVVMFLFFSGYGVMTSIEKKEAPYVHAIPRRRILPVLVNFDLVVVLYILLGFIIGARYPWWKYLLSFIAWENIGNSNWYIFVILLCYAVTWISAEVSIRRHGKPGGRETLIISFLLLFLAYSVLSICKEPYWYDTLISYPLGMAACLVKPRLDRLSGIKYWGAVCILLFLLIATYSKSAFLGEFTYTILSVEFALLVVLLLKTFSIGNPVLLWLGENLFPLYVLQRIPMTLIAHYNPWNITGAHPILFVAVCLILTLLMVPLYNRVKYTPSKKG